MQNKLKKRRTTTKTLEAASVKTFSVHVMYVVRNIYKEAAI